MKKTLIMMMSFLACTYVQAQKMTEPEYIWQVNCVNADSTVTLLKTENSEMKGKSNGLAFVPVAGMFLGKGQSYLVVKGVKSENVLPHNGAKVIVRVKDNEIEPKKNVGIIKFDVKKKERRYLLAESNVVRGTKSNLSMSDIPFTASKFGKSSYIVSLGEMQPGEYGIMMDGTNSIATFTVE